MGLPYLGGMGGGRSRETTSFVEDQEAWHHRRGVSGKQLGS